MTSAGFVVNSRKHWLSNVMVSCTKHEYLSYFSKFYTMLDLCFARREDGVDDFTIGKMFHVQQFYC